MGISELCNFKAQAKNMHLKFENQECKLHKFNILKIISACTIIFFKFAKAQAR